MEQDQTLEVLLAYGADPQVLEEYDCVALKARVVNDVVKIRTQSGLRGLKKVYVPVPRLDTVFHCTEYIAAKHGGRLTYVPRFIRTQYGDPYVNHVSGLYYMTGWHTGREADLQKETEFMATAELLARWHQSTEGCTHASALQPRTLIDRLQDSLEEVQVRQAELRKSNASSPFERLFLSCADELQERTRMAMDELTRVGLVAVEMAARKRGLLCHGNLSRQSVVYDGSTYALLHYDSLFPGAPVNDLAMYIHRYLPAYEWDPDILARVIQSYREGWSDPDFDEGVLHAMLGAPLRSLQVVRWYFRKAKNWDEEDYMDYLETSLEFEEARAAARGEPALTGTAVLERVKVEDADEGTGVPGQVDALALNGKQKRASAASTQPRRRSLAKSSPPARTVNRLRKKQPPAAGRVGRQASVRGPRLWGNVFVSRDDS